MAYYTLKNFFELLNRYSSVGQLSNLRVESPTKVESATIYEFNWFDSPAIASKLTINDPISEIFGANHSKVRLQLSQISLDSKAMEATTSIHARYKAVLEAVMKRSETSYSSRGKGRRSTVGSKAKRFLLTHINKGITDTTELAVLLFENNPGWVFTSDEIAAKLKSIENETGTNPFQLDPVALKKSAISLITAGDVDLSRTHQGKPSIDFKKARSGASYEAVTKYVTAQAAVTQAKAGLLGGSSAPTPKTSVAPISAATSQVSAETPQALATQVGSTAVLKPQNQSTASPQVQHFLPLQMSSKEAANDFYADNYHDDSDLSPYVPPAKKRSPIKPSPPKKLVSAQEGGETVGGAAQITISVDMSDPERRKGIVGPIRWFHSKNLLYVVMQTHPTIAVIKTDFEFGDSIFTLEVTSCFNGSTPEGLPNPVKTILPYPCSETMIYRLKLRDGIVQDPDVARFEQKTRTIHMWTIPLGTVFSADQKDAS